MPTLRVREMFTDSRFSLFVLEATECQCSRTTVGFQLYGTMKPVAIIVRESGRAYAIDMEAKSIGFDQLAQILTKHVALD